MAPAAALTLAREHVRAGRLGEAEGVCRDILRAVPNHHPALHLLALVLERTDRLDQAREACDRALVAGAGDEVRFRMATMLPAVYDDAAHVAAARRGFIEGLARLRAEGLSIPDPAASVTRTAFALAYQGENDREPMEAMAALFREASPALSFTAPHVGDKRLAGERLRVGFVSRFFYEQTVGSLMEGMIGALARTRFDVHVLAPPRPGDPTWERIAAAATVHPLPGTLAAAQRVLARARLDVLVFAGIGMDSFLYFLAFGRYARVQAATWGHPVTTGLSTIDHYLSSRDAETGAADGHYTESLVRLARPSLRYARPEGDPGRPGRAAFGLPEGVTLYGCLQTVFKFHPDFDAVLRAVLEGDPEGRLVLQTDTSDPLYDRLRARLKRSLGPLARRAVMVPRLPRPAFRTLVGHMDVLLDPLHFGGGQTTLEAIAMGTPVVTLPSTFRRGRLSFAHLRQAGVTDTVAHDPEDYVARALALGRDPAARAALGERLRAGAARIFDDEAAVVEMEDYLLRA